LYIALRIFGPGSTYFTSTNRKNQLVQSLEVAGCVRMKHGVVLQITQNGSEFYGEEDFVL
jgi:hypothetical protein